MQKFESSTFFDCPTCENGASIDIEVPELNFEGERAADQISEGAVAFQCPACENPFTGYCISTPAGCTINAHEHELTLEGDPPFYSQSEEDEWIHYKVPDNAYEVFGATYDRLLRLLDQDIATPGDDQAINRMIFMQLIAAKEAFLADMLIATVLNDRNAIKSLALKDRNINQQNFTLRNMADNEFLLENTVEHYLRKTLYHDLNKVRFLYKSTLGLEIITDDNDWRRLLAAVLNRHDCVHRNGVRANGEHNDSFTKEYVRETLIIVQRLVERVSGKLLPNSIAPRL